MFYITIMFELTFSFIVFSEHDVNDKVNTIENINNIVDVESISTINHTLRNNEYASYS